MSWPSGPMVFCLLSGFLVDRLVTQTSDPVVNPEAPGGHLQLAQIHSYVNPAYLRYVFSV